MFCSHLNFKKKKALEKKIFKFLFYLFLKSISQKSIIYFLHNLKYIKSFSQVWSFVGVTLLAMGPALWVVIAAPTLWQRRKRDQLSLLNDCCWFTTSLFLRQRSYTWLTNTNIWNINRFSTMSFPLQHYNALVKFHVWVVYVLCEH